MVSYQSHPELVSSGGTPGLDAMQMSSAQRMQIGDFADVEAGGTLYVVHTSGYASGSRPFLKITTHPMKAWTIGYRMATSQNLQSFAGLDSVQQELPVAVMYQGRMQTEQGLHQEFAASRKTGQGLIQISYYRDSLDRVAVSGGGALGAADMQQTGQAGVEWDTCRLDDGEFSVSECGIQDPGRECDADRAADSQHVGGGGVCDGRRAGGEGRGVDETSHDGDGPDAAGCPDRDDCAAGTGCCAAERVFGRPIGGSRRGW